MPSGRPWSASIATASTSPSRPPAPPTPCACRSPIRSTTASQLQRLGVELARAARRLVGQDELTLIEREVAELAAIRTFVTSVVRTETVTRGIRQITFGGGDLAHVPAARSADQFLYVLAPPAGRRELTIDAAFTWEQFAAMPAEEQPIGAYYTVRRWRPDVHELDLLFVLHGIDADGHDDGTGGAVGRGAPPGDPVACGDRGRRSRPRRPPTWYLLVADDTGLPAVAAIIESLPAGTPIEVVAEVDSEEDRLPLPDAAGRDRHVALPPRRGAGHDHGARSTPCGSAGLARRHAVRLGRRREQGHHGRAALPPRRARAPPGRPCR